MLFEKLQGNSYQMRESLCRAARRRGRRSWGKPIFNYMLSANMMRVVHSFLTVILDRSVLLFITD